MRSPRTECPLIEESMDDRALWHTVIKRSGRKGGTSKGNWWVPDKAQGNPEESGVLEGNYHTARRRLTNAANKPNFFYCGSTKVLFHLNITQKFPTWTTPNNLMLRVILSVQKWPEPHFQPLSSVLRLNFCKSFQGCFCVSWVRPWCSLLVYCLLFL